MPPTTDAQVFISYSHKDENPFVDELREHLQPFVRSGISVWSDRQIQPGSQWLDEIKAALAGAKVAVLMVSPAFLASDFIHEHELGPLLKQAERGGIRILWIPVRACSYQVTPIKNYQAVLAPDKPLAEMGAERDKAWVTVCKEIQKALLPVIDPKELPLPNVNSTAALSQGTSSRISGKPQSNFFEGVQWSKFSFKNLQIGGDFVAGDKVTNINTDKKGRGK